MLNPQANFEMYKTFLFASELVLLVEQLPFIVRLVLLVYNSNIITICNCVI